MNVQSISSPYSPIFSLDEILQDILETAIEKLYDIEETYQNYKEELNKELKTTDRVWLEFHAGQCEQYGKPAKSILYRIVKSSVNHPENSVAAANAITILKVMRVSLSCLDLREIQISDADLSSAILDKANLSDANLENVNLTNASLNGTNMSMANLKKVEFGMPDIFVHEDKVLSSIVSSDNKYLVSEDSRYMYFWDLSSQACKKTIEKPISGAHYFNNKTFTPDSKFLLIYDGKQYVDIWSVTNFEHINKLEILDNEANYKTETIFISFSPNGTHLLTYYLKDSETTQTTHLKVWEIKKSENNLLDINLTKEVIIPYLIFDLCFSKKFPIFYLVEAQFGDQNEVRMNLSIWNIEEFFKLTNISNTSERYSSQVLLCFDKSSNNFDIFTTLANRVFSLGILNTSKCGEELLFFAIDKYIYSINIFKKNQQSWALESTQITKIITEVNPIQNVQILEKTYELIYSHGDSICLYSIKHNRLIGKYRLLDTTLSQLFISLDEANIYITSLKRISVYSIDRLRNNKYISYETDSTATCFSTDIHSIISLNNSYYMQMYHIETGNVPKLHFPRKIKSHISNESIESIDKILLSNNIQFNFIQKLKAFSVDFLLIINTATEETWLNISKKYHKFALSNDSKYLALVNCDKFLFFSSETTLVVYKTEPSKQHIGSFNFSSSRYSQIAISTNFSNTPKVALMGKSRSKHLINEDYLFCTMKGSDYHLKKDSDYSYAVIVCNFVFKYGNLVPVSQKKFPIDHHSILQLMFTENDSKLIIADYNELILWDIEQDQHEKYKIDANYLDISQDGSLLVYYNYDKYYRSKKDFQLCLWSVAQKKPIIVQSLSLPITKLQISPDNRYIIGTVENGGMYVWKILENTFRLLWRTTHNLQTQGLILGSNNIEKDVEDILVIKMGAMKISDK